MLETIPELAEQPAPVLESSPAIEPPVVVPPRMKLGEILVERGKLDQVALERTLRGASR